MPAQPRGAEREHDLRAFRCGRLNRLAKHFWRRRQRSRQTQQFPDRFPAWVVILTVLLPVGDHQVHTHAPARIPGIAPAVEAVTSVAYNDGDRTGESFSFDWVNATGPPLLLYGAPQTDRVRVTWIDVQHLLYLHARGNSFSSNRARALSRSCRTSADGLAPRPHWEQQATRRKSDVQTERRVGEQ